jgi:hypothetical protein
MLAGARTLPGSGRRRRDLRWRTRLLDLESLQLQSGN